MRIFISLIAAILSTGCETPTSDKTDDGKKLWPYGIEITETDILIYTGDLGAVKKHLASGVDVCAYPHFPTTDRLF